MKGINVVPGMPFKGGTISTEQNFLEAAVRERQMDWMYPGVIADSQSNSESVPFLITPDTGLTIRVQTGTAVGPQNSYSEHVEFIDASDLTKTGGERIRVSISDTTSIPANNYQRAVNGGPGTGTGTGPFKESSNGMGGWVSTPQSTGTRNIPLTNGVINYVWVGYLTTVDPSVTSIHKVNLSQLLYPEKDDGYDIVVTASAGAPSGDPKYLRIGTVDLTTSPVTPTTGMISMAGRAPSFTRANRVSFLYDSTTAVLSAPIDGTVIPVDSFLSSRGTGTVTPTNILGLSVADLGFTEDVHVIDHKHYHHSPGLVVPVPTSTSSALYPQIQSGGFAGALYTVGMRALSVSGTFPEELVVAGLVSKAGVGTPVVPFAPAPLGLNVAAGDPYVGFGVADPPGTYSIYTFMNVLQATLAKTTTYTASLDTYLVCEVVWDGAILTALVDKRLFGTVGTFNIQKGAVGTPQLSVTGVTPGVYGDATNSSQVTIGVDGRVTAAVNVVVTPATFTGPLFGDVTGTQGATVVSTVGTSSAANVHTAELAANAATALNTPSAIVKRDGSGNFTASTMTGTATQANNLNGGTAGDVPYQSATDVTGFVPPGTTGQYFTSTGVTAPIWTNRFGNTAPVVHVSGGVGTARTDTVTYTNGTQPSAPSDGTRPLLVMVSCNLFASNTGSASARASVGGSVICKDEISWNFSGVGGAVEAELSFWVPPGGNYRIDFTGSASVDYWAEGQ